MSIFKKPDVPSPDDFMPKKAEEIDTKKRYDIYSQFGQDQLLIYKNIKFLGTRSIPGENQYSAGGALLIIQQEDGTELLISSYTYFCVCEHGKKPDFEIKPINKI
jgi:hypothetical protein